MLAVLLPHLTTSTGPSAQAAGVTPATQVWGFGDNERYQLAVTGGAEPSGMWHYNTCPNAGDCGPRSTPVASPGIGAVLALGGGQDHSLALSPDGTVRAWGANEKGQLGSGAVSPNRATPQTVPGLTDITAIAAGGLHSLALRSDGTVWGWGYNYSGQVGDGSTTDRVSPVRVAGLSGAVAIGAGWGHSIALKSDGTVWAWGYNGDGQLGISPKNLPNRVTAGQVPNLAGVAKIASANRAHHNMVIKTDGTVWAWGNNYGGELGQGTSGTDSHTPLQVQGLGHVTAVAAGADFSIALRKDGSVLHWGTLGFTSPGCGGFACPTPMLVPITDVVAIAAGDHGIAIRRGGTVWTWGSNHFGQLGQGQATQNVPGVSRVAGITGATIVAAGDSFNLVGADAVRAPYVPPPSPPTEQSYGNAEAGSQFAPRPQSTQSDPVNSATGAFITSATDLALPGVGLPFVLSRSYNSDNEAVTSLGQGWSSPYSDRLDLSDPSGEVELHAADGQQIRFTKTASGDYTGAFGATARLQQLPDGRFTVTTRARVRYTFDSAGVLTAVTDRNDQGWTLAYGPDGRLASATGSGRTVRFTHDSLGRLTEVAMPDARTVRYAYTGALLSSATGLDGAATVYEHDTQGRLARITDANAHTVIRNVYDPTTGRVVEQYDAHDRRTTFEWDATTQTSTMTDPRGHAWKDTYAGTVLLSQTDPLGGVTRFEWDAQYRLVRTIDPRGLATELSYDADGHLVQERTPDGATYAYAYDAAGNQTGSTSPSGITTTFHYDERGNATGTTRPDPSGGPPLTTAVTRDPVTGLVLAVRDAKGKSSTFEYDPHGNQTASTTPTGRRTTSSYDAVGRTTSTVAPLGNVTGARADEHRTRYSYDDGDRLLSVTDPLGQVTTHTYDAVGNLRTTTDAKKRTTSWLYSPSDQVLSVQPPAPASPTTYTYDETGNLKALTRPGNRTVGYEYDAAGRMSASTSPHGRWTFGYDRSGNRTTVTDPSGSTVRMAFDPMRRLTAVTYAADDTPDVTYGYDVDGNRAVMTDGAGTVSYGYDSLARLTSVRRGADAFTYRYDAADNLVARTFPGQTTDTFAYDDDGRLTSVATGSAVKATYAYDGNGRLTTTTLGNGFTQQRTWDRLGRLSEIADTRAGATLSRAAYTYDATGNPTQVVDHTGATTSNTFDHLDQLTATCFASTDCATATDYIRWTYDEGGNRTSEKRPSGTTSYSYDAKDQLVSTSGPAGTTTYTYDALGNQTGDGRTTSTYNQAGRLSTSVTGNATTTHTYDGDGRRLRTTGSRATTNFLWDPVDYDLALERDGAGAVLRRYTYGAGLVDMTTPGVGSSYFHVNGQGSPLAVTDAAGATQWRYTWEPFGTAKSTTQVARSAPTNPRQWLTEYRDPNSYHLRARQYDPTTGRFVAPDAGGTTSPYGYGNNNPYLYADALGLWPSFNDVIVGVNRAAGVIATGATVAAVACAATVVCAPAAPVLGTVALASGAVTAGTGMYLTYGSCRSGKGSCASTVAMAAIGPVIGRYTAGAGDDALRGAAGIVYRRTDINGTKPYVGQAKNEKRFAKRQKEHARANPDADFEYDTLGRAPAGPDLDRLEEFHIRSGGGPTNASNPDGGLANKRHQMSDRRYSDTER